VVFEASVLACMRYRIAHEDCSRERLQAIGEAFVLARGDYLEVGRWLTCRTWGSAWVLSRESTHADNRSPCISKRLP
jgi:hypothetical protein